MRSRGGGILAVLVLASAPGALAQVDVSPETTVALGAFTLARDRAGTDDLAGTVTSVMEPFTLPAGANLTAFDRLPQGFLFSPDVTVVVQGVVIGPGDVALYAVNQPLTIFTPTFLPMIVFSSAAEGLPPGTRVDAVSRDAAGDLLISFDTAVVLDGITFEDEDVALVPAAAPASMAFDGSAAGLAAELDVDGVHADLPSGDLLLSFDISGAIGGVPFDDEDVLAFTPPAGPWAMAYDGSAEFVAWGASDLDATSTPFDTDGDGTPDGNDNCGLFPNPTQADTGGLSMAVPDGIGSACQCGDVSANGQVTATDALRINQAILNLPPVTGTSGATMSQLVGTIWLRGRCNVSALTPDLCTATDSLRINQAILALGPGLRMGCPGELPP
jgi:hypothetical protein